MAQRSRISRRGDGSPSTAAPAHVDVLIITALPDELKPIRELFSAVRMPSDASEAGQDYLRASIRLPNRAQLNVVLAHAGGKGVARMTALVTAALPKWNPRHVVLAGIAAGVPEAGAKPGTLLVARTVVDASEKKLRPVRKVTTTRRRPYPCDDDLVRPLEAFADDAQEHVLFGQMICQPDLVKAASYRRLLTQPVQEFFDEPPIGLEMEGAGLAIAVSRRERSRRPSFVVVKGAVDYGNFHKSDAVRTATAAKVAAFLFRFLSQGWIPPIRGDFRPPAEESSQPSALIGRGEDIARLLDELRREGLPATISIEGIGGIGKTALAKHLIDVVECEFEGVAQFTVDNGLDHPSAEGLLHHLVVSVAAQLGYVDLSASLPDQVAKAVLERLERSRALVFLDNFEQRDDLVAVAGYLDRLGPACRSRVLLTSRPALGPLIDRARVKRMEPLDREDSIQLVRQAAARRSFEPIEVSSDEAGAVFDLVGGNPQALLVAAGLFLRYPGDVVLQMLKHGQGAADDFYRHVYLPAWYALSQDARDLLISMRGLPDDGVDWDRVTVVSGLSPTLFSSALGELLDQNLLVVRREQAVALYSMHRLTRTFVESVVASWARDLTDDLLKQARRRNIIHTLGQIAREHGA